jgi:hypothetical protein
MDLVAFLGKTFAQFGSDHPATAKSRVTNYSDFFLLHKAIVNITGQ